MAWYIASISEQIDSRRKPLRLRSEWNTSLIVFRGRWKIDPRYGYNILIYAFLHLPTTSSSFGFKMLKVLDVKTPTH